MDPSQSNPEGQSNRADVAMGSSEAQQNSNSAIPILQPPVQQQLVIINSSLISDQINS